MENEEEKGKPGKPDESSIAQVQSMELQEALEKKVSLELRIGPVVVFRAKADGPGRCNPLHGRNNNCRVLMEKRRSRKM